MTSIADAILDPDQAARDLAARTFFEKRLWRPTRHGNTKLTVGACKFIVFRAKFGVMWRWVAIHWPTGERMWAQANCSSFEDAQHDAWAAASARWDLQKTKPLP